MELLQAENLLTSETRMAEDLKYWQILFPNKQ